MRGQLRRQRHRRGVWVGRNQRGRERRQVKGRWWRSEAAVTMKGGAATGTTALVIGRVTAVALLGWGGANPSLQG